MNLKFIQVLSHYGVEEIQEIQDIQGVVSSQWRSAKSNFFDWTRTIWTSSRLLVFSSFLLFFFFFVSLFVFDRQLGVQKY